MKESKHKMKLYHGTNYSSAINIVNHGINLKYSKPYLDFGPGFYTTPSYDHAALACSRLSGGVPLRFSIAHRQKICNAELYEISVNFDIILIFSGQIASF